MIIDYLNIYTITGIIAFLLTLIFLLPQVMKSITLFDQDGMQGRIAKDIANSLIASLIIVILWLMGMYAYYYFR